jgi:ankyrin repeat protein
VPFAGYGPRLVDEAANLDIHLELDHEVGKGFTIYELRELQRVIAREMRHDFESVVKPAANAVVGTGVVRLKGIGVHFYNGQEAPPRSIATIRTVPTISGPRDLVLRHKEWLVTGLAGLHTQVSIRIAQQQPGYLAGQLPPSEYGPSPNADLCYVNFIVVGTTEPSAPLGHVSTTATAETDLFGGIPRLHFTAYAGDLALCRQTLSAGADVDERDSIGRTALHWAARYAFLDIMRELLQAGADPNATFLDGQSPLHAVAIECDHLDDRLAVIDMLVESGADPNSMGEMGMTCLHFAVMAGNAVIVKHLTNSGADINARGDAGSSLIESAVCAGNMAVVEALVAAGVDVSVANETGDTPLHFAAACGHDECIRWLVSHGANTEAKGKEDATPLRAAIMSGQATSALTLIECGANVDCDLDNGEALAVAARAQGMAEVVDALLKRQADPAADRRSATASSATGGDPAPGSQGSDTEVRHRTKASVTEGGCEL